MSCKGKDDAVSQAEPPSAAAQGQRAPVTLFVPLAWPAQRRLGWIADATALCVFFAWMIAFGRGTQFLESTRFDLLAALRSHGAPGFIATIMMGYGIAGGLAMFARWGLRRRLVIAREVRRPTDSCAQCGYLLASLPGSRGIVLCPECSTPHRAVVVE